MSSYGGIKHAVNKLIAVWSLMVTYKQIIQACYNKMLYIEKLKLASLVFNIEIYWNFGIKTRRNWDTYQKHTSYANLKCSPYDVTFL